MKPGLDDYGHRHAEPVKRDDITETVARLVRERGGYKDLCERMLATLLLPNNRPHLPPILIEFSERWGEEFGRLEQEAKDA